MSCAPTMAVIGTVELGDRAERSSGARRSPSDVAGDPSPRSVERWLAMTLHRLDRRSTGASPRVWSTSRRSATPEATDDRQLMTQMIAGDRDAFTALYDRHARAVFGLLLRVVGDRPVAEELVQETFLRVWQHALTFDPGRGAARPWILGIAHNLGLNEHRRRRSRPVLSAPEGDDLVDPRIARLPSDEPDPADHALRREQLATVAAALAALPDPQQEVIRLYAVGHTQEEIARRLDAPLGTVKTRMRRGLLRLRDTLRQQEVGS